MLVGQLKLQQLRRTPDAAERIFDFVGEVANELFVGLRLVKDALLAIQLELLHVFAQLNEDRMRRVIDHGNHHADR